MNHARWCYITFSFSAKCSILEIQGFARTATICTALNDFTNSLLESGFILLSGSNALRAIHVIMSAADTWEATNTVKKALVGNLIFSPMLLWVDCFCHAC